MLEPIDFCVGNSWDELLRVETNKPYFGQLMTAVANEYATKRIYPPRADIFKAFALTPYDKVKVLIIGQDPYHEEGEAEGLAFSVSNGKLPPSLKNIYKELSSDIATPRECTGSLTHWASQGVLLLNTVLTVEEHKANSHATLGWQTFTSEVVRLLADRDKPMVFILWGNSAKKYKANIDSRHLVLESAHPSPLSAYHGFFGNRHFSKANEFLRSCGESDIIW